MSSVGYNITSGGQLLTKTNERLNMLSADFSGLEDVYKHINEALLKLHASDVVQSAKASYNAGEITIADFDKGFAEVVRKEIGKTLGIIRAKAVRAARSAGAGSASGAVLRRTYKNRLGGNVNIAGNRRRLSSQKRVYEPGEQRTVSGRTKAINEYYGPDRGFILRWLDGGTDVRVAKGSGVHGRGTRSSWGRRGAISGRNFFHNMGADMQQAAEQIGITLVGHVEEFINKKIQEA